MRDFTLKQRARTISDRHNCFKAFASPKSVRGVRFILQVKQTKSMPSPSNLTISIMDLSGRPKHTATGWNHLSHLSHPIASSPTLNLQVPQGTRLTLSSWGVLSWGEGDSESWETSCGEGLGGGASVVAKAGALAKESGVYPTTALPLPRDPILPQVVIAWYNPPDI